MLTRSLKGKDENVEFFNGDVASLIEEIRQADGKDIFIDGGAQLVFELMKQNLIDRFVISVIPVLLGSGVSLFQPGIPKQSLKLTDSKTFPTGLVQLWYDKVL